MMNCPTIDALHRFIEHPDKFHQSYLVGIPALFRVLEQEFATLGHASLMTIGVCRWLYLRAELVRQMLLVHSTDPPNHAINEQADEWTKVN